MSSFKVKSIIQISKLSRESEFASLDELHILSSMGTACFGKDTSDKKIHSASSAKKIASHLGCLGICWY